MHSNWYESHQDTPLPLDVLALSRLTPPSPILTSIPTTLVTAWSWSEIPITFDVSEATAGVDSPVSSDHVFIGLGIRSTQSVSSVGTLGTFGPIHRRSRVRHTMDQSHDSPTSSGADNIALDDVTRPSSSPLTVFPSGSISTCTEEHHEQESILPSLASPCLPPSLYTSSLQDDPILRLGCFQIRSSNTMRPDFSSPDILTSPCESYATSASSTGQITVFAEEDNSLVDLTTRKLSVAVALASLESRSRCHLVPSSPSKPHVAEVSSHGQTLEWLRNKTVEIQIDQEGFREVLARFKFSGYVSPEFHTSGGGSSLAQFRPVQRQVFMFHYALLDSHPVLRRITVDGDESRDYISRQASLGLKVNGVYFVSGNETLSFMPPGKDTGTETSSKLRWRFEYMVDSRKTHVAGKKIINGEKILTPLSFSCSPLLLHPLQGKRVKLLHVMKKCVISKLVAEKMEPPSRHPSKPLHMLNVESPVNLQENNQSLHKRTATYGTPLNFIHEKLPSNVLGEERLHLPRRRRASSAGEHSLPILLPHVGMPQIPYRGSLLCRNIIPPSRLAALMGTIDSPEEKPLNTPRTVLDVNTPTFYPLSPCPRHHRNLHETLLA